MRAVTSTRVQSAKSAKHSASIGLNFPDRRGASKATSVGGLYHYFENAGAIAALGSKRTLELSSTMTAMAPSGLSRAIPGKLSSRPR